MSEPGGDSVEELRRRLIQRSARDVGLRQRLLADPKGTVEQELDLLLPETLELRVVEETPDTIYLVLPPRASVAEGESAELSERELENVAGGVDHDANRETLPLRTVGEGCWKEL